MRDEKTVWLPISLVLSATACVAFFALAVCSYQTLYAGFHWDDGFYLLMADRYSPYTPDRSPVLQALIAQRNYPPLYPLLLAWAGGGSAQIGAAKLASTGLIVLGMLALLYWLPLLWSDASGPLAPDARIRPAPPWMLPRTPTAVAACLLMLGFIASPAVLLHFQTLWSEHAYIAFSLCALAAAAHAKARATARDSSLLLAAFFVTLAALSRSAGVALVLAFALYALCQSTPRRWWAVALATAPFALERAANAWLSTSGHSYQGHLWQMLGVADVPALLARQIAALWQAWLQSLSFTPDTPVNGLLAGVLLVLMLGGLARRLRQGALEAWYVLAYLGLITLWPFPDQHLRFLYPLLPVLLGLGGVGLIVLMGRLRLAALQRLLPAYGLLLVVLMGLPASHTAAQRLVRPLPPALESFRFTEIMLKDPDAQSAVSVAASRLQFIEDMQIVAREVPPSACVLSEFPILIQLYTKRWAVLPPWRSLRDAAGAAAVCPYYYLIPIMLPATDTAAQVAAYVRDHQVLAVSASPRDPTGREQLGILLRMNGALPR